MFPRHRLRGGDAPVLASRAREVLGADEGAALARLRPAAARRDYLAAHALARTMLAELAGSDPARLRFRCPPRGRPELVAPPVARHLRFSISHADGIALCAAAAAGCVVGADVESLRNVGPDPLGVAESVCSRREMDALAMLPASARAERLLSIWTAKEAVAKATGLGFRLPLPLVAVHEESNGPPAESRTGAAEEKTPWRPRVLAPDALPRSGGRRARRILGPRCAPLRSRGAFLSGYRRPRFMEPTRSPCRRCSGQGSPRSHSLVNRGCSLQLLSYDAPSVPFSLELLDLPSPFGIRLWTSLHIIAYQRIFHILAKRLSC